MLERLLEELGLSDKEAKVYLALLALGQSTAHHVAKKAGVTRPTAYFLLEELGKQGLISISSEQDKKIFVAEHPDRLAELLAEKQDSLEKQQAELEKAMPEFVAMFALVKNRPQVRIYEGVEGQHAMRDEAARNLEPEIYSWVSLDDLYASFENYRKRHEERRIKSKTISHVIYTRRDGPEDSGADRASRRKSRYVPQKNFPFRGSVTVHPNRGQVYISMYYQAAPVAAVIESREIADMFLAMWRLSWEGAEKYNK